MFTIDLLRCVYCGFCVDACPKEAIVMSRHHEMAFASREEAIVGLDDLLPVALDQLGSQVNGAVGDDADHDARA